MIDRKQFMQEQELRRYIRKGIKVVLERRNKAKARALNEEKKLRTVIRELIKETKTPDNDPAPHPSTGINVLEDLLKKIIPNLEMDFKKITSDPEQRKSYRAHIINAVEGVLNPVKVLAKAGQEDDPAEEAEEALQEAEDIEMEVDETPEDPAFIDVGLKSDAEKSPPDPKEEFGIEGMDKTGRNMAFETFKRVETNIIDAYDMLGSDEDRELFYDYLITNLKLYFDKFEEDLAANVDEPSTEEYEEAAAGTEEGEEDLAAEDELGAEEL